MIGPEDDLFHPPTTDDFRWSETYWFTFHVPERKLSCHIYPWFKANLAVAGCGIAVWDDTAAFPEEMLWWDWQPHLPWPDGDLNDLSLANGLRITCREPLQVFDLSYRQSADVAQTLPGVELAITFEALRAPFAPNVPPGWAGRGHFDQPGRVTGWIDVYGERIEVDCLTLRDRSWGPRPDQGDAFGQASYASAIASDREGFHIMTMGPEEEQGIVGGFLLRDGEQLPLVAGTRTVERVDGRPVSISIEAEDSQGRVLETKGVVETRGALPGRPNLFSWVSLTRWSLDGKVVWGEDQDVWGANLWRATARTLTARTGRR